MFFFTNKTFFLLINQSKHEIIELIHPFTQKRNEYHLKKKDMILNIISPSR